MNRLGDRRVVLALVLLATWPVWRWFVGRTFDGSDEPLGILALCSLLCFVPLRSWQLPVPPRAIVVVSVLLAIYAASFHRVPPLIRGMLAMASLGALLIERPHRLPLWGLCGLSLPIVATLQFYFGYSLRVIAAGTSAAALSLSGFPVARDGTMLRYADETILVDAPCSGIRMLWFGLYLACVLAAFYRLNLRRFFIVCAASIIIVIAANVLRATILFFKEAQIVRWPEWTHAGVGMLMFAFAAGGVIHLAHRLQLKTCAAS